MSKALARIAQERRLDVLDMDYRSKGGHIGGSMSCMDILITLYYDIMDIDKIHRGDADRDRFILSKGHCADALYSVLADRGFFPKEELLTYAAFGTRLAEHPTKLVPGVELATGALGHGLSAGSGLALAFKRDFNPAHVYVLMGDGELAEGSIWEAAMLAAKYKLSNLTAIVDRNRLQISGSTEYVMPLDDLKARFMAFNWNVVECDGHNHAALQNALRSTVPEKPTMVICNTIKGKGSSVMENKADWHHKVPSAEEYARIQADLLATLEENTNG